MNADKPLAFDLKIGNTVIEVKTGVTSAGMVRQGLIDLAIELPRLPKATRALLVVVGPRMTAERLRHEWQLTQETLRPEIAARLSIALYNNDHLQGFPKDLDPVVHRSLEKFLGGDTPSPDDTLPRRPDYTAELSKILIHQWLLQRGSVTTDWLASTVGCTYPTVAKALKEIGPLKRHSNRRIELAQFPDGVWGKLIANADRSRNTLRYVDKSGKPRSAEILIRRLTELDRSDIAFGGVVGAREWYADFDLLGTPRLDLTIHCLRGHLDVDFIHQADPGLALSTDASQPPLVVLHTLRRQEPFFQRSPSGMLYADPVECLLDLHEAHLDAQAAGFLEYLEKQHRS